MFCLGCGAETPPHASVCPVCKRALGGQNGSSTVQWSVGQTSPQPKIEVAPPPTPQAADALPAPAMQPDAAHRRPAHPLASQPWQVGPSITRGDMDIPGLPHDLYGRVLLITVVAMAADLLAPWVVTTTGHLQPAQFSLLSLGMLILLAVAVLPAIQRIQQRRPIYTMLPIVVGGFCLGIGALMWGGLPLINMRFGDALSPDIGLYLFLLGSIALIVVGYQMFFAAATAAATAQLAAARPATAMPIYPAVPATRQRQETPAAPATEAQQMTTSGNMWRSPLTPTYAPPAAPFIAAPPQPSASEPHEPAATAQTDPNGLREATTSGIALPGSAAWNQEPSHPQYVRQSAGNGRWLRGPRQR